MLLLCALISCVVRSGRRDHIGLSTSRLGAEVVRLSVLKYGDGKSGLVAFHDVPLDPGSPFNKPYIGALPRPLFYYLFLHGLWHVSFCNG